MAKEFIWQGRTEEQIKRLDIKTFMTLVPSRQRRSLKRGLSEQHKRLLKKVEANDPDIKTHCRDMIIMPAMIGKTIKVYNGKEYVMVLIMPDMIGHFLGEFSHTRKSVTHSSAGIGATRSSKAVSAR
ncbi:30S ribosomal protein S19 [Candidatus Woesearchaeota archaeon]|nr:30S ribosomal protein S19 [Candidatus Woesearchaeota archaeon]